MRECKVGVLVVGFVIGFFGCVLGYAQGIVLSDRDALYIGKKIWKNECKGTVEGLTSWNEGEEFASLGIGHFIWYPKGQKIRYYESFPLLMKYFEELGISKPSWLHSTARCPWPNRAAFMRDLDSPRMRELREFLVRTIPYQARYMARRLENSLPNMLRNIEDPVTRERVRFQFNRVASHPHGIYALMDYVNFKGEGLKPQEEYNGHRWGLMQVLKHMRGTERGAAALREFSDAAIAILTRRALNAPPGRNEMRWLPGWRNRCLTYRLD
ncbi:MAG: hypothetical protein RML49_05480 [Verrucomicrobiae bacterium]|nr:hypothetical protein [Verrucomicrobiae bacterium]